VLKKVENEGKRLDKLKLNLALATLLLVAAVGASFLPGIPAGPTTITTITPNSGPVGTPITLVGEIDTASGSYAIFFDEEEVKSGTAVDATVDDTFIVPSRPKGNYTVKLHDATEDTNDTVTFTIETTYYIEAVVPTQPEQLQEGDLTEILVNVTGAEEDTRYRTNITVTDPSGAVYHNDTLLLTNTTNTGYGEGSLTYPTDFGVGAHTNYAGTYNMALNGTLQTGNFTIGLTNSTEYHRFQVVNIRAANYTQPNEYAWVSITFDGKSVFSQNVSAISSLIEATWVIPDNASMGRYTATVANSTAPGTVKSVPDTQNFTIAEIPFQVRTIKKLDGEVLADVRVDVYNATEDLIGSEETDENGLVSFSAEGGNYSFKAFWAIDPETSVVVGTLFNQSIKGNVTLDLLCWMTNLRMMISPPIPFINVTLTYYNVTSSFETDRTAIIETYNVPTNISYTIEARRYGFPFYNETIDKLPAEMGVGWVNITIICPTYNISVQVLDSKSEALSNVEAMLIEWSSGVLMGSRITDPQGKVNFSAKFGRYGVEVYNYSTVLEPEVILNKTTIDLIEDNMSIEIHCKIFNVDLYVETIDYFGQPIRNALVEIERKSGEDWVKIDSSSTKPDGFARFAPLGGLVGGDCRVSVFVAGKLSGIKEIYLVGSMQIRFKIGRFTSVAGHPIETSQLIVYISIGLLAITSGLALSYRRLLLRLGKKKKES